MPKPTEYDKTHLRNMAAIGTRIDRIFKKAAEEAAKIGVSLKIELPEDRIFSFDDYPQTRKQIERLMAALQESTETTIVNGVRSAWTLSNNKNNALVSRIFGDRVGDLSKEQYRRYFSTNGAALDAFLQRKEHGLNLSDRVWRYTEAFKHEIELGLDLGIRTGESAASMTRSLRQYLQHPDKLFRRVRDKHGNLRLSKAAKAFHPGQGVYRSSYKNARRLACTETNIAYRTSDHLRWQQMEFVVGIEIRLSNNHTLNGVPLTDICDELKGRYPKDFKFTGWHPHCRCHVVTVLKTEEEMTQDTQRILNGQEPDKGSVNTVRDVPAAFKGWVEEHADRIENARNLPYFISDNRKRVDTILGIAPEPSKTPLEIAQERHAARTPEQEIAIQQKWNRWRLDDLREAISDGYLPKECKEAIKEMRAMNDPEHFEEINTRIATLQKAASRHKARTPQTISDIQQRWNEKLKRDAMTRKHAGMVLNIAKDWEEITWHRLEQAIANGNLMAMQSETKAVMAELKAMRAQEKALADFIPDVHEWHKTYTLAELQAARKSVEGTMDYYKTKFGADLAAGTNLEKLKSELEYKIKFVENPGKYKAGLKAKHTWQVEQAAYKKQLAEVEAKIELNTLNTEYTALLGFKTTSKDFKDYMAKAKAALEAGDPKTAKSYIASATWKKQVLEHKRKGGVRTSSLPSGAISFPPMDEKTRKRLVAEFSYNTVEDMDDALRKWTEDGWALLSHEERLLLTKYTQAYTYLNDRLRGLPPSSWRPQSEFDHDMPIITAALNKFQAPRNMVVRRGVSDYKMTDLKKYLSQVQVGDEFTDGAFLSTACHREKGFFEPLEMIIVVPKGARGVFAEPFSHYNGHNCAYDFEMDELWNGKDKQSIGGEFEWIGQRGCRFRVFKKVGSRIYLELIGQLT